MQAKDPPSTCWMSSTKKTSLLPNPPPAGWPRVWHSITATAVCSLCVTKCPWDCHLSGDTSLSHSKSNSWIITTFPHSPTTVHLFSSRLHSWCVAQCSERQMACLSCYFLDFFYCISCSRTPKLPSCPVPLQRLLRLFCDVFLQTLSLCKNDFTQG